MAFLLDTNIISETVKPRPEPRVLAWVEAQRPTALFLAAQTMGELLRGARKLAETPRRERIENWIETELSTQFDGRILAFDDAVARTWGRLMGDADRAGRTPSAADAHIAAVAIHHKLTVVTRNSRDFAHFALPIFNPWFE